VLTNTPSGASFKHHDEAFVSVSVQCEGDTIKRSRGKKNLYFLNGEEYAAFGKDVPDEIAKVAAVGELNFQGQMDTPGFWFSLSPSDLARELNKVVDLSIVDRVLASLSKSLRDERAEQRVTERRLNEAEQSVASLEWVEEAEKDLQALQELAVRSRLRGQRASRLNDLVEAWLSAKAEQPVDLTPATEAIAELEKQRFRWEAVRAQIQNLEGSLEEAREADEQLKKEVRTAVNLEEKLHEEMEDECPLCGTILW
jgi:hypothetical protein